MAVTRVEKLGPWGGNGGEARDTGHTTRLARIKINHQNFICTMQFQYVLNGVLQWSPQWGRDAIGRTVEIILEEGEFLCSVSGHRGPYAQYHIVTSLTLISNKQKYGPFGKETGTAFGLPQAGNNKIVGFHGRAGGLLDAIGVYMETYPSITVKDATEREELSKKVVEVTEENNALKEAAKNHIKELEELSKKVVEVTAENNALKETVKNHIKEREELSKKVVEVTAENNALKEAAKNHIKSDDKSKGPMGTEEVESVIIRANDLFILMGNDKNYWTLLCTSWSGGDVYTAHKMGGQCRIMVSGAYEMSKLTPDLKYGVYFRHSAHKSEPRWQFTAVLKLELPTGDPISKVVTIHNGPGANGSLLIGDFTALEEGVIHFSLVQLSDNISDDIPDHGFNGLCVDSFVISPAEEGPSEGLNEDDDEIEGPTDISQGNDSVIVRANDLSILMGNNKKYWTLLCTSWSGSDEYTAQKMEGQCRIMVSGAYEMSKLTPDLKYGVYFRYSAHKCEPRWQFTAVLKLELPTGDPISKVVTIHNGPGANGSLLIGDFTALEEGVIHFSLVQLSDDISDDMLDHGFNGLRVESFIISPSPQMDDDMEGPLGREGTEGQDGLS